MMMNFIVQKVKDRPDLRQTKEGCHFRVSSVKEKEKVPLTIVLYSGYPG